MTKEKVELSKFEQMRSIDVSEYIEKKNKFSYLSWAWALDILLRNDPDATWSYGDTVTFSDGSVMVSCTVTAFGKSRTMQLPVIDHQNKVILNPNAFQFNTSMQRCLVKAIACHGLGLYVYAGEDVPDGQEPKEDAKKQPEKKAEPTPEQKEAAAKAWIATFTDELMNSKTIEEVVQKIEAAADRRTKISTSYPHLVAGMDMAMSNAEERLK